MREGPPEVRTRSARRRRRGVWRWLAVLLAAAVAGYALLSAYLPAALGARVAQAVTQQLGSRAQVTLLPGPLWHLAQGRFDRLQIRVARLDYQGLRVQGARLDWRSGQVDIAALLRGQLVIVHQGVVALSGTIATGTIERLLTDAVRPYLPSGSAFTVPTVEIAPQGVSLDGDVDVLGVQVPYQLEGTLRIAPGGGAIEFATRSLNQSALHLPAVPVLQAKDLPKVDGISWRFRAVSLGAGSVRVTLQNAP